MTKLTLVAISFVALTTAASAAERLTAKQMDAVTAGYGNYVIGQYYFQVNTSFNQTSTPGTGSNNNNGVSGNQVSP